MSTQINNSSLIERLFKVGAHFGFRKSRRHPTTTSFLYATKDGNDIFDLEKTAELLEEAKGILREAGKNGKTVLFVGTKTEVVKIVKEQAEKADSPYVVNRWIGGILTNASEIKKRISRLDFLTKEGESGELERKYTKKERVMLSREVNNLNFNFKGVSEMTKTPDYMVVVDPRHDYLAVKEAKDLNIPIIGIMSSDCDAKKVTYPVPANDALQGSVQTILSELTSALIGGREAFVPKAVAPTKTVNYRRIARN